MEVYGLIVIPFETSIIKLTSLFLCSVFRLFRVSVKWMKDNNPELNDKWLHQTKHEFGICFTTDFELMSCP